MPRSTKPQRITPKRRPLPPKVQQPRRFAPAPRRAPQMPRTGFRG